MNLVVEIDLLVAVEELVGDSGDEHFEFSFGHAQGFGVVGECVDVAFDAFGEALLDNLGLNLKIAVSN